MLNHQKLNCYQMSLRLVKALANQMPHWPSGVGYLKDQIRRASSSIVLNIAEGAGKLSPQDRRRFYSIARGSLLEVSAGIDVANALGLMNDALHADYQA